MKLHTRLCVSIFLIVLIAFQVKCEPKFGRGGGGRGGRGGSSGGHSFGGSRHSSSGSKGNWFSNFFFGSKVSSAASAPSSSHGTSQSHATYPKQPAHNPTYSAPPPAYDTIGGVRQPPSYGSLSKPNYAGHSPDHGRVPPPSYTQSQAAYGGSANYAGAGPKYLGANNFQPHQQTNHFPMFTPQTQSNYILFGTHNCRKFKFLLCSTLVLPFFPGIFAALSTLVISSSLLWIWRKQRWIYKQLT